MGLAWCASGVDYVHPLRCAGCYGQVGVADASKKSAAFLLKTVLIFFRVCARFMLRIPAPRAFDADCRIIIQQDGQIRLQISAENFVQAQHRLGAQLSSSTLVGLGGISKAITEHDA